MASVPIGGVRVDLTLNSAAFIRDIAKSSAATAKSTKAMSVSLGGLHSSFIRVQKIAAGFLAGDFGLRAISRLKAITSESLKLAETLGGDVGEQAKATQRSLENFGDAFQFGVAQGFLNSFSAALGNNQDTLNTLTLAGSKLGEVVGTSLTKLLLLFDRMNAKAETLATWMDRISTLALDPNFLHWRDVQPGTFGEGMGGEGGSSSFAKGIQDATGNVIAFNAAQAELLQQMKDEPGFWDATTTGVRNWTEALRDANSIIEQTQTPLEAYRQKIEEIQLLESARILTTQQAAVASQQAAASLVNTWLGAVGAVTGALTQLFEGNKAVAIANAVINTAEAITAAIKNPPGPPFSFVYAAAAAAAGAAQIATILAAKPGSGSKAIKTPKGGGATAKAGAASTNASTATPLQQSVNITIEGESFGPEHFKRLVAGLNGVISDGAVLNVST